MFDARGLYSELRRGRHRRSEPELALVTSVGARSEPDLPLWSANECGNKVKPLRPGPSGHTFEEPPQARLIKIAHGRLAAWLDPFGMLPSQVVVDLSLKLGHGVRRVTD